MTWREDAFTLEEKEGAGAGPGKRLLALLKRGAELKRRPVCFLPFRGALSFRCAAPLNAISAGEVIVQGRRGIFSVPSLPSGLSNQATLIPRTAAADVFGRG